MNNSERTIIKCFAAFVFMIITGVFFFSHELIAEEEMAFTPALQDLDGALEVEVSHRDYLSRGAGRELDTSSQSIYERINLGATGYIYHPRFIFFSVRGKGGLEEERLEINGASRKRSTLNEEYEIRTYILPEHPYSLELFAERRITTAPLLISGGGDHVIVSSEGASFRYRLRQGSLQLSAISSSTEGVHTYNAKSYFGTANYLLGPFLNAGGFNYTDSMSGSGTQATFTKSYFNNTLTLSRFTLGSAVSADYRLQTDVSSESETDTFTWSEHLGASLPLNVSAGVTHDYHKDAIIIDQGPASPEMNDFNRTLSDGLFLSHQLYRSLTTSFSAAQTSSESGSGSTDSSSRSLSFAYRKMIPSGAINAGYEAQRSSTGQSGAPAITRESQSMSVPGSFTLNNQSADASTVSVMVRDPVTSDMVLLTEHISYEVVAFGNTVQIQILNVPAGVNPPPPPSVNYFFVVTYSLLRMESKIEMTGTGFNLGISLLEGLFSPYYRYYSSVHEVVSGDFALGNDHITTETFGYRMYKDPFMLLAEYTSSESRISPSRSWMSSVDYRQSIIEDVEITARALYSYKTRRSLDLTYDSNNYFEEITGLDAAVRKAFPAERLSLSAGGSYTERKFGNTGTVRGLGINGVVNWRIGKLHVTARAAKTQSRSARISGDQSIDVVSYNVLVSRKIF